MSSHGMAGIPEGVDAQAWLIEHYRRVSERLRPPQRNLVRLPPAKPLWRRPVVRQIWRMGSGPGANGAIRPPQEAVIKAVAMATGISVADIVAAGRTRHFFEARQIAALIMRERGARWTAIGRRLGGRDHATALNAARRGGARLASDPDFAALVDLARSFAAGA